MVKELRPVGLRRLIIDFLAVPAACDQPCRLQLPQVVGYSWAAHIYQSGNVDHAFFAVTQKPEDPDTASVSKLFENIGDRLKIFRAGHLFQPLFHFLPVIMGQSAVRHKLSSFLASLRSALGCFPIVVIVSYGRKASKAGIAGGRKLPVQRRETGVKENPYQLYGPFGNSFCPFGKRAGKGIDEREKDAYDKTIN